MSKQNYSLTRRQFIYSSAIAAGGIALSGCATSRPRRVSANEKLNIGIIGCGGKGASDANGVSGENIIALCDVDANTLNGAAKKYPGAKLYRDYRKMLEKEKTLDAVTVSTPDHHHFPASMTAIQLDKHVYCQKPLTHSVWEARMLTLAARKHKVATQMGNQGHSGEAVRDLCEMIWSGAIGEVREAHCWTDRPAGWWPQGVTRPAGEDPVPAHLDWDLWIGPAPWRPFKNTWPDTDVHKAKGRGGKGVYHPFSWRGWWDFGCGALGDMGCHVMDGANWALKLGYPTSVEVVDSAPVNSDSAPEWAIIRYQFPARGGMPPLTLTWSDGGKKPARPDELGEGKNLDSNGTLFIGDKGKIVCGTYSENPHLLPESRQQTFIKPAQTIPRVPDNSSYADWIRACKGGPPACSNFDYAGPFTEVVLLGNLALRLGKKIEWDGPKMRAKNLPEADKYIHPTPRKGWKV